MIHGPSRRHAAFTLVELLLSMAVMALLITATTSAIFIAGRAIPNKDSTIEKQSAALEVAESIAAELATATRVSIALTNQIEFEVPDRGHGSVGNETIRYTWNGTAGAALTRSYNGNTASTVCEDVYSFALTYTPVISTLTEPPKVLLFEDMPAVGTVDEKQALMESWGFQVTKMPATKTKAELDPAIAAADVIFLPYEITTNWVLLLTQLGPDVNKARGVVIELGAAYNNYGISTISSPAGLPTTSITITDISHEITAAFAIGTLAVSKTNQNFVTAAGTYASGAQQLATSSGSPSLGAIELGAATLSGNAKARRVHLPCGGVLFDVKDLTDEGESIIRRAMVWAAAPVCHGAVTVTLQSGSDSSTAAQAYAQLVNSPRVETP